MNSRNNTGKSFKSLNDEIYNILRSTQIPYTLLSQALRSCAFYLHPTILQHSFLLLSRTFRWSVVEMAYRLVDALFEVLPFVVVLFMSRIVGEASVCALHPTYRPEQMSKYFYTIVSRNYFSRYNGRLWILIPLQYSTIFCNFCFIWLKNAFIYFLFRIKWNVVYLERPFVLFVSFLLV